MLVITRAGSKGGGARPSTQLLGPIQPLSLSLSIKSATLLGSCLLLALSAGAGCPHFCKHAQGILPATM